MPIMRRTEMKRFLQPLNKPRMARGLLVLLAPALVIVVLALLVPDVKSVDAAVTRHYYIAADEVDWDYAPLGYNGISGLPFSEDEDVFVQQGDARIGHVYHKVLYRE